MQMLCTKKDVDSMFACQETIFLLYRVYVLFCVKCIVTVEHIRLIISGTFVRGLKRVLRSVNEMLTAEP